MGPFLTSRVGWPVTALTPGRRAYIPRNLMKHGRRGWTTITHVSGVGGIKRFNGAIPRTYNTGFWEVVKS